MSILKIVVWAIGMLPVTVLTAQSQSPEWSTDTLEAPTLRKAFTRGEYGGTFRSYLMATDNKNGLTDYYAWAAGGSLHFQSAPYHGFQMGIGGMFNFNLLSSDLSKKDPKTGAVNRYEIGLFDVEDASNKNDLDRMDEFWLRYRWRKSRLTIGKQTLQTPFINAQDGRMRPTTEAAFWLESEQWRDIRIEGGWIWKISPRSTVRWYDIGTSIGLYPRGLNPDGTASGYAENLSSKGIALLGITKKINGKTRVQVWDQFVENIFNTAFAQVDYKQPLGGGHHLLAGVLALHQNAVSDGGNTDASKTYFQKNGRSSAVSAQVGWQKGGWQVLGAYTHITDEGRFLSPREWGREPFYTFLSRERVEGSGRLDAATLRANWTDRTKAWNIGLAGGYFSLPDVKQVSLNKYAFPGFYQINADLRYSFRGLLEGLRVQFLYVYKGKADSTYGNDKLVINRVDMSHVNLIINYSY